MRLIIPYVTAWFHVSSATRSYHELQKHLLNPLPHPLIKMAEIRVQTILAELRVIDSAHVTVGSLSPSFRIFRERLRARETASEPSALSPPRLVFSLRLPRQGSTSRRSAPGS